MAVFTIAADNNRVDDAENSTGWTSRGSGQAPSAEASFAYVGTNLVNKKITGTGGVAYNPVSDGGVAEDFTATGNKTLMCKGIVSDFGGLNAASGVRVYLGNSSSVHYMFDIAGTDGAVSAYDTYLPRGGLFIVPIDPNVAAYRSSTTGSPDLTTVDYFAFEANFDTSTAKAENVGMDAIDIGTGLTGTGGTGVDPAGTWADFVAADEGTVANRWGYAQSLVGGAISVGFGQWTVGSSAVATEFLAQEEIVLWPDGLYAAGFSGLTLNLENAASIIEDNATHISLGTTATEDTRGVVTWEGTAGTGTAKHTFNNLASYTMTSAVTFSGNVETSSFVQAGGTVVDGILRANTATNVAMCVAPDLTKITNSSIQQTGVGHAWELTTGFVGTSVTLTGLNHTGFGGTAGSNEVENSGAADAALLNSSGKTITLVINGGVAPTIRNTGTGSKTIISNPKTVTLTPNFEGVNPADYEWRLYEDSVTEGTIGTVELDGAESETTFSLVYGYTYVTDTNVTLQIIADEYIERLFKFKLLDQNQQFTVDVEEEENT